MLECLRHVCCVGHTHTHTHTHMRHPPFIPSSLTDSHPSFQKKKTFAVLYICIVYINVYIVYMYIVYMDGCVYTVYLYYDVYTCDHLCVDLYWKTKCPHTTTMCPYTSICVRLLHVSPDAAMYVSSYYLRAPSERRALSHTTA